MKLILAWFYYALPFMAVSLLVTNVLNRYCPKLYWAPLLINFVSLALLIFLYKQQLLDHTSAQEAFYFNYLPVVVLSVLNNSLLALRQHYRRQRNAEHS